MTNVLTYAQSLTTELTLNAMNEARDFYGHTWALTSADEMRLCLGHLVRHMKGDTLNGGIIEIARIKLSAEGEDEHGRYYGTGAPLFSVALRSDDCYLDWAVRAASRAELRAALKRLYPKARVGR